MKGSHNHSWQTYIVLSLHCHHLSSLHWTLEPLAPPPLLSSYTLTHTHTHIFSFSFFSFSCSSLAIDITRFLPHLSLGRQVGLWLTWFSHFQILQLTRYLSSCSSTLKLLYCSCYWFCFVFWLWIYGESCKIIASLRFGVVFLCGGGSGGDGWSNGLVVCCVFERRKEEWVVDWWCFW